MGDLATLPAFASGTTYTHADFNAAFAALTLATSFHTGKATLASYSTSVELTVYDPASAGFKKGTLGNIVFSNDELVFNRTNNTTPLSTLIFLAQDPATKAYTKVPRQNFFGGMFAFTNVLSAAGALTSTAGDSLAVAVDGVTIEINTNALRLKDAGTELAKLSTTAKRNLAGAIAIFVDQQVANTAAQSSTGSGTTNTLRLGTTHVNTLTGASLAANQVTLAAGRYETELEAHVINGVGGYVELYNVTASAVQQTTSSVEIRGTRATGLSGGATIRGTGLFEIISTQVFELRARTTSASTYGSPLNLNSKAERYQSLTFRQAY